MFLAVPFEYAEFLMMPISFCVRRICMWCVESFIKLDLDYRMEHIMVHHRWRRNGKRRMMPLRNENTLTSGTSTEMAATTNTASAKPNVEDEYVFSKLNELVQVCQLQ
jgi:hypothetical protein